MITLHPDRTVIRVAEKPQFNPTTAITIAVDTAYVAAQQGRNINQGIYMMDNMVANGSSGEGTLELHTKCPVGSLIGFNTVPINGEGASGDQVIITGFTVSQEMFLLLLVNPENSLLLIKNLMAAIGLDKR